jgi:glycosyltransferase involved in cell wall biosynthesis
MELVLEKNQNFEEHPIVTIGVCVKDSERTIEKALSSIFFQVFSHNLMEVIIVDDGSKDATLSRAINFVSRSDIPIKIFSGEWIGLGRARNLVVQNSRGKYIIWVDGDMIIAKDFVSRQVSFMQNSPTVAIAKGTVGIRTGQNLLGFLEDSYYFSFCFRNKGSGAAIVGTGGSICRCDVVRAIGGFNNNLSGVGEDIDLEYRVRQAGWSLYMQSPGVYFEQRRTTWFSLWREYYWHGLGGSTFYRNNQRVFSLWTTNPVAGFLAGVIYSVIAYKFVRRKVVFLLPIQYVFKRIAWCSGFVKGQIMGLRRSSFR